MIILIIITDFSSISSIFSSLFPSFSPSLPTWRETAVVSKRTESNPHDSNGCEIGLSPLVKWGQIQKKKNAALNVFYRALTIGPCRYKSRHFGDSFLWLIIERPGSNA